MATMIPSMPLDVEIRSDEDKIFYKLRDSLPKEVYVAHSFVIYDQDKTTGEYYKSEIDFLIIIPDVGCLIVESKNAKIYPEIKTYLNDVVEDCKLTTYTTTIFNRRRYIKEINSSNHNLSEFAKRTAMNAPIQGSAADIIKIAMINVHKKMKELNLQSKMVAQVHDELIIDVHPSELEIVKQMLKEIMESAVSLKVKMIVDVEEGKTWDLK